MTIAKIIDTYFREDFEAAHTYADGTRRNVFTTKDESGRTVKCIVDHRGTYTNLIITAEPYTKAKGMILTGEALEKELQHYHLTPKTAINQ